MAAVQRIYEENDTVDDTLLNQISKFIFYENLFSLARDLGIPQTQISGLVEIKYSQEKIFQVLHTWNNKKSDSKVKDLVQEMFIWQEQGYLDRTIWHSNLFSPSLLLQRSSTSNETVQETDASLITPTISDQERQAFENEHLDPARWISEICQHFNIEELKLLKDMAKNKINQFLGGIKNTTIQCALRSLFRELKCLYVPPIKIQHLTDLSDIIDNKRKYLTLNRDEKDETKFNEIVDLLESPIWKWHQSSSQSYEFLTFLATLSLFDFSFEELSFNKDLQEKEITEISTGLRRNFDELKTLRAVMDKQAFVLNIALSNPFQKKQVVQYIVRKLPQRISPKLHSCTGQNFDLLKINQAVQQIITRKGNHLRAKAKSLSMYFNSIFARKLSESPMKAENGEIKESVKNLLEDLGLVEYYPQKLSYSDVIKVTEDTCKGTNETPSSLQELPWFFLRRLIGLDSTIREKGSVIVERNDRKRKNIPVRGKKNERKGTKKRKLSEVEDEKISFSWNDDSSDEDTGGQYTDSQHEYESKTNESVINSVHPLDLIYLLFLCADDFLRQELADKMSKCQYAVPFILPTPKEKEDESKNTVLSWGLRTISRTYCEENGPVVTKTLHDISCPLVSFLNININTTWKSKLLNKMLSPQQDTFWHEGLEGGDRTQKVSQGMVEVSWYLPAGRGHDEFKTPVTFTDLRGDANQFPIVTETLCKLSTCTCIFTDKINKDVLTFLEKYVGRKHLKKLILVILYNPAEENTHVKHSMKLKEQLNLHDCQVVCRPSEDSSFHTTYDSLKRSLQTCIDETTNKGTSILKFIDDVKSSGCMKVDDVACSDGYKAAQGILEDIVGMESDKVKSNILPCQSDLATREEIGRHEKEICRQKYIGESDLITQYMVKKEEEKWELQWKQLQYPLSNTFTYFLLYIIGLNSIQRKYFLQTLKLGLNERSIELLQPLYEDYEKYRLEEKCQETDRKLRDLNEQLTYSSLGLEHFFREMAVMYENMAALSKKLEPNQHHLDDVLEKMSKTMADIVLEGEAIEILDGDAVHSPILWLKAVLTHIESSDNIHIFKVSALGAQSSGKSTLLNTVFGLNFPVSSGRCTRGAYLQLVKIDGNLAKRLQCDYLLVIDSEGLMSRVSKNDDYDNELATFVIGLSDLTLVVIKGEGNEMQDVLPIAIHVFLRMNVLGERQACHFVHQNMGAIDVKKTQPVEIDTFVQLLDEKTRAAAQEAWKKKYTRFTDVLHYDKNKDNTYVSGLWDGSPPMGKTDLEYSNTMQKLKGNILERLENVPKKKHSTLEDFSKWLECIWEAVKYENFVFSFRNVLAVETYKRLSRILNDKEWEIKKTMREIMNKKKKEIKSKMTAMVDKDNSTVKKKIEQITEQADEYIKDHITPFIKELLTCIQHYFNCPGCLEKDCNEEVRNRQFLRDYKREFEHDIVRFMMALEDEISQSTKNLVVELSSHQDSAKMDEILKKKVRKVIEKAKCLTEEEKKKIFDDMWETETEEIVRKIPQKKTSENHIKTTVENTIKAQLGTDDFRYIQKKADKSKKTDDKGFSLKQEHANGGQKLAPHTLRYLRRNTAAIVKGTSRHYRKIEKGRKFEQKHAETLFVDIQKRIERIKHEGIETTLDYKVDLMMHIGDLAVTNFSLNQKAYEEYRCPRKLLDSKKNAYFETFQIATGLGNPAMEFGNIISKVAEENLEDQVTCTALLSILRNHEGDIFGSTEALITSTVTALMQNTSKELKVSLNRFENLIKDTIKEKSISCLKSENRLKGFAKSVLGTIMEEIKEAIEETRRSSCKNKDFIGALFSDICGLRKLHNDIEAYKMVAIDNKVKFAETLITQLTGPIFEQLQNNIESWDVANIIERKGLIDFTFKETVGCLLCTIQHNSHFRMFFDKTRNYQILLEDFEHNAEGEMVRSHNCKGGHGSGTCNNVIIREISSHRGKLFESDDNNEDDDDDYHFSNEEQSALSHFDFLSKIAGTFSRVWKNM